MAKPPTQEREQIAPTPMAYRIPKAAELIGVKPATLWRKIARGEIGAATVIRHVDLQAFINAAPAVEPKRP